MSGPDLKNLTQKMKNSIKEEEENKEDGEIKYITSDLVEDTLSELPIKEKDEHGNYIFYNQKVLFSYPSIINKKEITNFICLAVQGQISEIKQIIVSQEKTVNKNTRFTHVLVDFGKRFRTTKDNFFQFQEFLPTIRMIVTKNYWTIANNFMRTADPSIKEEEKSIIEQIHECSSEVEAIKLFRCKDLSAIEISHMYKLKLMEVNLKAEKIDNLYAWQDDLIKYTYITPKGRNIIWITDLKGGKGKTQLIKHLINLDPEKYKFITHCNNRDLSTTVQGWLEDEQWTGDTILVNLVRTREDQKIYEGREMLLDSMTTSQKYKGKSLAWKKCHVVVFCNFFPKLKELSLDRWRIHELVELELRDYKYFNKETGNEENYIYKYLPKLYTEEVKDNIITYNVNKELFDNEISNINNSFQIKPYSIKEVIEKVRKIEYDELYKKEKEEEREKILRDMRKKKIQEELKKEFPGYYQ
jgi:hypothetical protein